MLWTNLTQATRQTPPRLYGTLGNTAVRPWSYCSWFQYEVCEDGCDEPQSTSISMLVLS